MKVGLQEKTESFACTGQGERPDAEQNHDDEQEGHQNVRCFFQSFLYPAFKDNVIDEQNDVGPDERTVGMRGECFQFGFQYVGSLVV